MLTDDFEWDDAKAASNLVKHGVTFEQATFAFDDHFAQEEFDIATDEPRSKFTGWNGRGCWL